MEPDHWQHLDRRRRGHDIVYLTGDTVACPGFVPEIWLTLVVTNYLFKVGVEILLTPVTYQVVNRLKRAEGQDYFDSADQFQPF